STLQESRAPRATWSGYFAGVVARRTGSYSQTFHRLRDRPEQTAIVGVLPRRCRPEDGLLRPSFPSFAEPAGTNRTVGVPRRRWRRGGGARQQNVPPVVNSGGKER